MLLESHTEFIVQCVMPDHLHVVSIGDNPMHNGICERQFSTLALRLVPYVAVLWVHSDHDSKHLWSANERCEDGAKGVVTAKPALHMPEPLSTTSAATSLGMVWDTQAP